MRGGEEEMEKKKKGEKIGRYLLRDYLPAI